jgi:hypothetical protein
MQTNKPKAHTPNHLLYGFSWPRLLSTCPGHPRAKNQIIRDGPDAPESTEID